MRVKAKKKNKKMVMGRKGVALKIVVGMNDENRGCEFFKAFVQMFYKGFKVIQMTLNSYWMRD